MAANDPKRKGPAKPIEDIDPDKAPEPKPFQAPKGLLRVKGDEPDAVEIKSGAAPPPVVPPAPAPPGAHVKMDRPVGAPKPRLPSAEDMGEVDIRFQKPEPGAKPAMPTPADLERFDVQFQKGAPKLPRLEAPGEFDVVRPHVVPEPHPVAGLPHPLEGEVEVKDYRRTGPVELEQVPDPFAKYKRIGVVDTTFARANMGDAAEEELRRLGGDMEIVRRTVPGIKDLAVECKILFERYGCEIVIACGMVGAQPVDKQCAHEASMAIQWTQLQTNRHILEVFVHEDEARDEAQLAWLLERRTREHAENAWNMIFEPQRLRESAGKGLRQGFEDAGPITKR